MILDDFPRTTRFSIGCTLCERRGAYTWQSLRDRFGDTGLPDILALLSSDCPRRKAISAVYGPNEQR